MSSKKNLELGLGGYVYQKKNISKDGLIWRCRIRSCPGRAKSDKEVTFLNVIKDHDHPPSNSSTLIWNWLSDLKKTCRKNPGRIEKTYKGEC